MFMYRLVTRLLLVVLSCALFITSVAAFGIVPSSHEITFEPDKTYVYKIKVVNNERMAREVLLFTEGELSSIISLDKNFIEFSAGEEEKFVTVTVVQPEQFSVQGRLQGRIIAREISSSDGQIGASLSVVSKFFIVVPYTGLYAETKLFIGDFVNGKQGNFIIEVNNLGTDDIASTQVYVNVVNAKTEQVVASLVSNDVRIPRKSKELFTIQWTPQVANGIYKAIATTTYDGSSVEDQKVFSIGSKNVGIESINVNDFSLGGIAKFNILLKNNWGDTISDVHAEVKVRDGSNTFATSTTQTVTLQPLGSQLINAYWDTGKVVPGKYELVINLFYEGSVEEKAFPITVKQNSIDTGFSGQVIGTQRTGDTEGFSPIYLLILLVIIVLVVNVILFKKLMKKK